MSQSSWKNLLLAAPILLWLGCATAASREVVEPTGKNPRSGVEERRDHQVMAILHQSPPTIWRRDMAELAGAYDLEVVLAWEVPSLEAPCVVFEGPRHVPVEELAESLGRDHRVALAEPIQFFRLLEGSYNDSHFRLQHGAETLDLEKAHRWSTGKGVPVALVDTGVDVAHPDLQGQVVGVQNLVGGDDSSFTGDIHGTALAGVIAARANNGEGIVGVAPEAQVLALKACWQDARTPSEAFCNTYTLVRAIDLAIRARAKIVNLSLAGPEDPILAQLLTRAIDQGAVVVAAVDEASTDGPGFPASLDGVIGVGIADPPGVGTSESRRHHNSDLVAPGIDILTTVPRSGYDFLSGSSLAAAHTTGVVALLLERDPDLTPAEVASLLRETAQPTPPRLNPGGPLLVVNACAALAKLTGLGLGSC
jgi:subtilisin family serine protease